MNNQDHIWVIAETAPHPPASVRLHLPEPRDITPVRRFQLSPLGHYLLNPAALIIPKPLIGYEYRLAPPSGARLKYALGRWLPQRWRPSDPTVSGPTHRVTGAAPADLSGLSDAALKAHLQSLFDVLGHHDPIFQTLATLPVDKIIELQGLCQEDGGTISPLSLNGQIGEKIAYLRRHLLQKVTVELPHCAHKAEGLFDLSGCTPELWQSDTQYQLIKFQQNGQLRYVVTDLQGVLEYEVAANHQVKYLHLFENCLCTNPTLQKALQLCRQDQARPIHLFFNSQFDPSYSEDRLPGLFRHALVDRTLDFDHHLKKQLMASLNRRNVRVMFNYRPTAETDTRNYYAAISVMHDVKAIEPLLKPIKDRIPDLYFQIQETTHRSEAGRFYLLEAMHGAHDPQLLS